MPLSAFIVGAIIVFAISRILLGVNSAEIAPIIALGLALVVLLGAAFISTRVEST
jgi:hypothetical protein